MKKNDLFVLGLLILSTVLFFCLMGSIFFGTIPYLSLSVNSQRKFLQRVDQKLDKKLTILEKQANRVLVSGSFYRFYISRKKTAKEKSLWLKVSRLPVKKIILYKKDRSFYPTLGKKLRHKKGFHLLRKDLILVLPYLRDGEKLGTVSFYFDYRDILEEILDSIGEKKRHIQITEASHFFFYPQAIDRRHIDTKSVDRLLSREKAKEGKYFLSHASVSLFFFKLSRLHQPLIVLYPDNRLGIPILAQICLLFLAIQIIILILMNMRFVREQEKIKASIPVSEIDIDEEEMKNIYSGGKLPETKKTRKESEMEPLSSVPPEMKAMFGEEADKLDLDSPLKEGAKEEVEPLPEIPSHLYRKTKEKQTDIGDMVEAVSSQPGMKKRESKAETAVVSDLSRKIQKAFSKLNAKEWKRLGILRSMPELKRDNILLLEKKKNDFQVVARAGFDTETGGKFFLAEKNRFVRYYFAKGRTLHMEVDGDRPLFLRDRLSPEDFKSTQAMTFIPLFQNRQLHAIIGLVRNMSTAS